MSVTYFGPEAVSKELFNKQLVSSPPSVIGLDVETISLKERMPIGFAIATSPVDAWYFKTYPEEDKEIELIWPLLRNPNIKKSFHNAIFDLRAFPLIGNIDRCLDPNTKVLKSDLTWQPIKEISVGYELIGIDEIPIERVRKLRKCIVEKVTSVILPAYRIDLDNGKSIVASGEHPWLAIKAHNYLHNNRRNQWVATQDIDTGDYIRNGFDVWSLDLSYEAGYSAGFLDGEGAVIASHNNTVTLSQFPNEPLDIYIRLLNRKGIKHRIRFCNTPAGKEFIQVNIYNQRDITRLLGSIRPKRLLSNLSLDGKEPCDEGNLVKVIEVTKLPQQNLVSIQTTTKTFVAEGFFTHNSNIADTNVMARLLGRADTKLFELAPEVGMVVQDAASLIAEYGGKTMLDVPTNVVAEKCAEDAQATLALYHHYLPEINPEYFKVEMDAIPILIDMSLRGLKVNQEDRAKLEAKLEYDVAYYRHLCEEEDFNPASNQQVGYILAKRGNFLPFTKARKNLKVNVEQLEFLDDPIAAIVLNFRDANKLLTTYIRPLKDEDRIYTEYSLDIVVGRIQSSNRNMQNIPPESRYIFEPDTDVFTTGDFSQEHLRILMHLSGDREMQKVYYEGEHGGDIHIKTAKELNITRRLAKTINYAIPYGATPWTVSTHAKIKDLQKCSRFIDSWFETYRDAAEWIIGAKEYGISHGKSLPTLFGREISIPEDTTRYGRLNVEAMERKAVNYPILGSDGEIMKRALIKCKHLPLAVTVHDSITCVHPDTLVLGANLAWRKVSDLDIGDYLVGVNEQGTTKDKKRRRLKFSEIIEKHTKIDRASVINFGNGHQVIASADHLWLQVSKELLVRGANRAYTKWTRTDELKPGMKLKFLAYPWETSTDWDAGYIAGLLDSEGAKGRRCLNFSQNEGVVLDTYTRIIGEYGLSPGTYYRSDKLKARTISINSIDKYLMLLGKTRPPRMLEDADTLWLGKVPYGSVQVNYVAEIDSPIELIDLQTSAHTFIAEGLITHNCDGDIEFPIETLETLSPVRIPFEVKRTERWE